MQFIAVPVWVGVFRFQTTILVFIAALLTGCQQGVEQAAAGQFVKAPAWSLESTNAETVHFPGDARGRPAILLFWATWCPYCKALMPHIQSILEEFPDAGLVVYAISFRDDGDPVAVIESRGFKFIPLLKGEAVAKAYGIKSTPGVFIVDGAGNIHFDLRTIQAQEAMQIISGMDLSHSRKAARKAPYYAAAIRKAIDQLFQSEY